MPFGDFLPERDAIQEPRRKAPKALETVRTAGRCDLPSVTCDAGFYPALPFAPLNRAFWAALGAGLQGALTDYSVVDLSAQGGVISTSLGGLQTTGHRVANTAFHPFGGVRMPSSPQVGHKPPHRADTGFLFSGRASE